MSNNSGGNRPPKTESGHFTSIRVLSYGFLFSLAMLGLCSFYSPQNMHWWGYVAVALGSYLIGNAKSTVDPSS